MITAFVRFYDYWNTLLDFKSGILNSPGEWFRVDLIVFRYGTGFNDPRELSFLHENQALFNVFLTPLHPASSSASLRRLFRLAFTLWRRSRWLRSGRLKLSMMLRTRRILSCRWHCRRLMIRLIDHDLRQLFSSILSPLLEKLFPSHFTNVQNTTKNIKLFFRTSQKHPNFTRQRYLNSFFFHTILSVNYYSFRQMTFAIVFASRERTVAHTRYDSDAAWINVARTGTPSAMKQARFRWWHVSRCYSWIYSIFWYPGSSLCRNITALWLQFMDSVNVEVSRSI